MIERVLVGTDGSASSAAAITWAAHLASAARAELLVIRAWESGQAEVDPETLDEPRRDASRALEAEAGDAARAANVEYRSLVVEGDPRRVLLDTARSEGADVLVVGARGTGSSPHALHLGSTAHYLAHHSPLPTALIPATARRSALQRIVIGVDGSPGSAHAVAWLRDIAGPLDAEVIAVYAELSPVEWVSHTDPKSWYRRALHDCTEWTAPLRDAGITLEVRVVEHNPVTALTEAGVRAQAGLLVVGTRGAGGISGIRLGSTALKVLHHSGLPVVLIPPERDEAT